MSQSVIRKPQPFTIGTRLSLPKCPEFAPGGPGAVDSCPLPLNERVSQYLAHARPPSRGFSPHRRTLRPDSPTEGASEDHGLGQVCLARAIKKITLSVPGDRGGKADPGVLALKSQGNFNNNNSRPLRDAVPRNWVPCISAPPRSWAPGIGGPPSNRVPGDTVQVISAPPGNRGVGDVNLESGAEPPTPTNRATDLGSSPEACRRDRPVRTPGADGRRRPSVENPQIAQLSRDITQAESWIRGKLRSLKERCDAGPLQDWEPGPHPMHSEIKGFEATVMKLKQIGEHLSRSQTPSTAGLRAQLQSLTGQWQLLKQTAANQSNAMGGAKVLQEFNKKADELEIWMREKEEKPSLPLLLDENLDKMRLTRQILDLKQEQLRYRNLQEDINSLAHKLEKQGRVESRGPSSRRKQLNKMWLRLQDSLQEQQKGLQLALEAATLWQQMDTILKAMEEKRLSVAVREEGDSEGRGDQEMRDIASQIMLLDITVSQISGLHPILASRAAQKQRQVKESWAQLQHALRRDKPMRPMPTSTFTREPSDPVTPSSVGNRATETKGDGKKRAAASSPKPRTGDEVIALHHSDQTRRQTSLADRGRQNGGSEYNVPNRPLAESSGVNQLMKDLSSTEQWLQNLEVLLSEPAAMRSPEVIRRNLREVSILEREVKSRGQVLHGMDSQARQPGAPEWRLSEETRGKMQEVKERIQMVLDALRRRASDLRDTLVLSEFMKIVQMEEERRSREMSRSGGAVREGPCDLGTESERREVFTPLEELQEAVEMLNDAAKERERAVAITKETENLEIKLSELSQRICAAQTWLDDIRRQTEVAERDFALVKSQTDLKDLEELFILQQELEAHVLGSLRLDVGRMEDQQDRLRQLCPQRSHEVARSLREALQAWAQLQEKVQETKAQLEKTDELRRFFLSYLEMISWTEDTRAQIFSESPCQRPAGPRGEELERRIEGKLKEFESLASIGWKFIGEEHFLTQTIKERMEELQGMLSWVLMRWRCQKQQRIMGNKMEKKRPKEVLEPRHELKDLPSGEVLQASGIPAESADSESPRPRGPTLRRYSRKAHSPMSLHSAGNEVDIQQGAEPQEQKTLEGPVWLQPKQMPLRAEREAEDQALCAPPLPKHPATFWRRCQGLLGGTFSSLKRKKRVSFPAADEVSACLHVKPPGQSACHSLTAPRPSKQSRVLDQCSPQCAPLTGDPTISSTKIRSHLLFSGPDRTQEARWRTVQGIMGASSGEVTRRPEEARPYQTLTWPPKQKKVAAAGEGPAFPLAKDIDSQCETFGSDAVRKSLRLGVSSSRRRLTLGSVLSLQIPKEGLFLGNVQETATESAKESGDETDNSMNNREPRDSSLMSSTGSDPSAGRSWIEALSRSAGYCRLNLHGYGSSAGSPTARWPHASHEDLFNFEIDRLSPIGVLHEDGEPEWDRLDVALSSSQDHDGSQVAEDMAREDSCPPPVLARPWRKASPPALPEVLHPDQDFLELDDEELEGIWNNARRGHVGFPTFTEPKLIKAAERPRPAKTTEVDISKAPGGQVVMLTKPNMLVATFSLPASAQVKDLVREQGAWESPERERSLSRGQGEALNRMASHQQKVLGNGPAQGSFMKVLEIPASSCGEEMETTPETATGTERLPRKLDFQLMEGPLEKKHTLQPGGKRATSRTWSWYHAVLVRRTLCFYVDRKHPTKSSVSAFSLHLTGAVCGPSAEYTKRDNCFCLRLLDGSEYLLRAPSDSLVHEWISKLQHNSGIADADLLGEPALGLQTSPSCTRRARVFRSWMPEVVQPTAAPDPETAERSPQTHRDHKEGTEEPSTRGDCRPPALSAVSQARYRIPAESAEASDGSFFEDDRALAANRRRSQSFSSVSYQKMPNSPSCQENSPSYSVTLYIGDSPAPRGRCHSFATSIEESQLRWGREGGHNPTGRPRNMSVFKKFFRKKD